MTPPAKAYSYIRFSTPEQSKGDSVRRQTERAALYALKHGMEIDDRITYLDYGVSAFEGANEETGRLGEFLKAVGHGDIVPGSFLLVESLDRLSRQPPRQVWRLLERICEAGIVVVTLDDERMYTEANLDSDMTSLLVALLVASRAHEESQMKARRLAAAWEAKRHRADRVPMSAISPAWLCLSADRAKFEIIPDRAKLVRRVFEMTLDGIGQHAIARKFNSEGVPVFGRGKYWHRSYIAKMLRDEKTIGRFTPHRVERVGRTKKRVPTEPIVGYYPAVVAEDDFERVQVLASGRSAGTSSGVANILAGLAVCPQCGSTMTRVNKGSPSKAGKPFLVCVKAKAGDGCRYKQVPLDHVHLAIVDNVAQLRVLLPSPDDTLTERWERLLADEEVRLDELENLLRAVEEGGPTPALINRLHGAEGRLQATREERATVERKVAATLANRVLNTVDDLIEKCGIEPVPVPGVNAILRQLFTQVIVDYESGFLTMKWQHADDAARLLYAMPEETLENSPMVLRLR